MRAILILLLFVITLSVTAQQRYRVTSKTEWQYDTAKREYQPTEKYLYRYKQDNKRGGEYADDVYLYYDTSIYYSVGYYSDKELALKWIGTRVYDTVGRIDTAFSTNYDLTCNECFSFRVHSYNDNGKLSAIKKYAEVKTCSSRFLDSNNVLIEIDDTSYGIMLCRKMEFLYDDNGKVVQKVEAEIEEGTCSYYSLNAPSGKLGYRKNYNWRYDSSGNIVQFVEEHYRPMYGTSRFVTLNRYDDKGKLTNAIRRKYYKNDVTLLYSTIKTYDKNKELVITLGGGGFIPIFEEANGSRYIDRKSPAIHSSYRKWVKYFNSDGTVKIQEYSKHALNTEQVLDKEVTTYKYDAKGRIVYQETDKYDMYDGSIDTRIVETTSYTSFGYISAYVKQYYHIEEDTAYKTEKTTYTYEAY